MHTHTPLIGAVFEFLGELSTGPLGRLMTAGSQLLSGKWTSQRLANKAKSLLGIDIRGHAAYRHDSVHPLFAENALHPDNLDALRFVAGSELKRAVELDRLKLEQEVTVSLEQNMVLIGSPTAEGLSRFLFGYREEGPDRLVLSHPPLDLPYMWQLDASELGGAKARRIVRDRGPVDRPNWHIVSRKGASSRLYIPKVDNDGYLETDYLVVTRLRNFFTTAATDMGRYIVSFGGTHGTATLALTLLLSSRSTLGQIQKRLKGKPESYQMLFEVGGMVHDVKRGTRATAIELLDVAILTDTTNVWREASETVRDGMKEWLGLGCAREGRENQIEPSSRLLKNS